MMMETELVREDGTVEEVRHCERCGKETACELVPLMGWSEWLCRGCAAAAYRSGEAV